MLVAATLIAMLHEVMADGGNRAALSPKDVADIQRLDDAYVEAWRRNDRKLVMDLFTPDAVIVPSGRGPIRGHAAIADFWWPAGGGKTTITAFEHTTDEIGGDGRFAFARGSFSFAFDYTTNGEAQHLSNAGSYVMLFARDANGAWKITHRMWSDRRR